MNNEEIKFIKQFKENYIYYDGMSVDDFITLNEDRRTVVGVLLSMMVAAGIGTGINNYRDSKAAEQQNIEYNSNLGKENTTIKLGAQKDTKKTEPQKVAQNNIKTDKEIKDIKQGQLDFMPIFEVDEVTQEHVQNLRNELYELYQLNKKIDKTKNPRVRQRLIDSITSQNGVVHKILISTQGIIDENGVGKTSDKINNIPAYKLYDMFKDQQHLDEKGDNLFDGYLGGIRDYFLKLLSKQKKYSDKVYKAHEFLDLLQNDSINLKTLLLLCQVLKNVEEVGSKDVWSRYHTLVLPTVRDMMNEMGGINKKLAKVMIDGGVGWNYEDVIEITYDPDSGKEIQKTTKKTVSQQDKKTNSIDYKKEVIKHLKETGKAGADKTHEIKVFLTDLYNNQGKDTAQQVVNKTKEALIAVQKQSQKLAKKGEEEYVKVYNKAVQELKIINQLEKEWVRLHQNKDNI